MTRRVGRAGGPTGVGSPARLCAALAAVGVVGVVAAAGVGGGPARAGSAGGGGQGQVVSESPVTAMHRSRAPANNSPQLAVHPDDDEVMALANRLDKPVFGCALHVSGDGGQSWVPVDPVGELPEGAETCYGPEVAFGPDGALYFLFAGLSGEGNTPMGVFVTRSDDAGRSFSEPVRVLDELSFGAQLAVDGRGRLHVAWIDADEVGVGSLAPPPNPIMARSSADGGATWSEPVRVSDAGRQRVVAPTLAVGADGAVHVAYYDLLDDAVDYRGVEGPVWDGEWEVVVASSTDGGASFAEGEVIAEPRPHERIMVVFTAASPALATGGDGRVCAAWSDAAEGAADVWARCRRPEGEWLAPVRVSDPSAGEATQELPQLAVAPDGRIDVVFLDGRRPPADDYVDVFYAASVDGGESFTAGTRVSQHTSYTGFGPRYPAVPSAAGMTEFGSRIGLASTDQRVVTAWTDTRNQTARSQGQDVFAAVVADLPGGPAAGVTVGWLAGAVAVGAAVVVAAGWWRRRRGRGGATPPGGRSG